MQREFEYHLDSGNVVITKYIGTHRYVVTVPDTLDYRPVTAIGYDCFLGNKDLERIILPNGITHIGEGAFANCRNLEHVSLPDTVVKIGAWAFCDCMSLTHVNLPPLVEVLESGMFGYCRRIREVRLPEKLRKIEVAAFMHSGVRKLVLPKTVTEIERGAFDWTAIELVTDLPINEEWFHFKIFGKKVSHDIYGEGVATGSRGDNSSCYEITVQFNEVEKKFFLPNDLEHGLHICDPEYRKLLLETLSSVEDSKRQYELWGRGMF